MTIVRNPQEMVLAVIYVGPLDYCQAAEHQVPDIGRRAEAGGNVWDAQAAVASVDLTIEEKTQGGDGCCELLFCPYLPSKHSCFKAAFGPRHPMFVRLWGSFDAKAKGIGFRVWGLSGLGFRVVGLGDLWDWDPLGRHPQGWRSFPFGVRVEFGFRVWGFRA